MVQGWDIKSCAQIRFKSQWKLEYWSSGSICTVSIV